MSDIDLDALEAAIRDGSTWLGNPGVLALIARVRNAEAAIQAVLTIHSVDEDADGCVYCARCYALWPCDTALAAGVVVDGADR